MRSERGRELHTLTVERVLVESAGDVREAVLACTNCRGRFPVIDGIPIVVPDLPAFLRSSLAQVVERELAPETQALLALAGNDADAWPHMIEHLSIYLDAHWGDRAEPPPDGPAPRWGMQQLAERLHARAQEPVERAVELGCSVGRGLAELAAGAKLVIGVDLHFAEIGRAHV